jgi:hypothetical protein
MWLEFTVYRNWIFVDIINYDNNLYYSLPKKEQDICGTLLLKAFTKMYKENYGKDSDKWLPINADFHNIQLYEAVQKGIKSGIFHPDSLKMSDKIDQEDYENDNLYNKNNRDYIQTVFDNFGNYNNVRFENGKVYASNKKEFFSMLKTYCDEYGINAEQELLYLVLNNGEYFFLLNREHYDKFNNENKLQIDLNDKVYFHGNMFEFRKLLTSNNISLDDLFNIIASSTQIRMMVTYVTKDDLEQYLQQTAKNKRLIKKING